MKITPCYIIAEMSANHCGSLKKALSIVRAAKQAGANAIKLQTYTADTMTIKAKQAYFKIKGGLWDGANLYELYQKASTPWEWHKPIQQQAKKLGLDFFSTPFDETAVDFLEELKVPCYKIASFELVDDPLLIKVAKTRKLVILSTGMATLKEITHAVDLLRKHGAKEIALLKCVSTYPARPEDMNLNTMADLQKRFQCRVGLSDHSLGHTVAVAAVSLGAQIIEKHLMMNKKDDSPDAAFSMLPQEFKVMVDNVRLAQSALGKVHYQQTVDEKKSLVFRRSIFAVEDIKKGEILTPSNIRVIRPGNGLSPKHYAALLGKRAIENIAQGMPLTLFWLKGKQ